MSKQFDIPLLLCDKIIKRRCNELKDDYFERFQQWKHATKFRDHYKTGARVWVPHPESVWEGGEVIEDYSTTDLKIKTDSGEVLTLSITTDGNLPPLRNPDILIGENDLTSLSYLHEPAVLYNLQFRFCTQNSIYTYCGIVLVAINPYAELPIYNSEIIFQYRGKSMGELDPHIFAVAEEAYTKMEREQRDQSIIVSGESGAGKTVSAKYAMRYFATVGGSTTETHIEKKVLASSPIMEAIGNAKTTRNDNSSRFGKFIELHFNKNYNIVGASMRTYLLEKSRVVFQAPEERNYHILYQLCAARKDYPSLQLDSAKTYKYLCQEEIIVGVDDFKCFQDTLVALQTLGFSEKKISNLFKVFASILHLGNISIKENTGHGDTDESFIKENDPHLIAFTELLQLDATELQKWLCHRRITSMRESFDKPMTLLEATGARDALAKYIYAELFNWIVEVINQSLKSSSESRHKFIGVLDIYGFETFETNSFEQFCINYANEKLQQQFNQHVFKLEQEEYLKEEIEWKFIDFYDNQPCIDLIETKLGILDLLDEECRMPKGSDSTWAGKLYTKCKDWHHFEKPRFGTNAFVIKHFADRVEYEVEGFLDKNRDTVIEEQVAVLKNGGNQLVSHLFSDSSKNQHLSATMSVPSRKIKMSVSSSRQVSTMSPSSKHKKTVGSQFRDSLNALMSTLNATTPHYIRCIKPNDNKLAFAYNAHRAVQQLRACGVLETIRISAAGFPSRWLYLDFFKRYRVLCCSSDIKHDNPKLTCERILGKVIKDSDKFKFGKNKIFFRAGQVAYLERLRSDRMRECCIIIQKAIRGFLQRKRYLKVKNATCTLQRLTRGFLARRRVHALRRNKAAVTLQRHIRGWTKRVQYQRLKHIITGLQALGRGLLARQRFQLKKQNNAAIIIQKTVRGFLCRLHYERDKRLIIIAQNAVRRFLARRLFKRLKREARSVEHVKSLNKGLENKIISLQQRIGVLLKENNMLKGCSIELTETRSKLEQLRNTDSDLRKVKIILQEKEDAIIKLKSDLDKEKSEKLDIIVDKEKLESVYKEEKDMWNIQIGTLNDKVKELNEKNELKKTSIEDDLRTQFEREKLDILREQDQDRDAYQKLLTEKNSLENHCDALQDELAKLTGNKNFHKRNLSDTSTLSASNMEENFLSSETHDEDFGYGSVRSSGSKCTDRSFPSDWSQDTTPESTLSRPSKVPPINNTTVVSYPSEATDIALILKLQQKLKKLENERDLLHRQIEERNDSPSEQKTHYAFKIQEFEMENSKLKADLESLRRAFADATSLGKPKADELMSQFHKQEEELVRRTEECVQLREVLANRTTGLKSVASANYSSEDFDIALINEDGELVLALEAQKKINRQLVDELQSNRMRWNIEREELVAELERLRNENESQQKLLTVNLSKNPQTQTEAYMQHEITRLTGENLDLQEKRDQTLTDYISCKKQLKDLIRKVKEAGVENLLDTPAIALSTDPQIVTNQPVVRMKERTYLGMFEFKAGDENVIIKHLVWDLKPQTAVKLLPGLPAYILFMCIRHTDYTNDENKVRALLTSFINTVKKVTKKKMDDVDTTVLWLSNTLRFLHNLKQYSGDKTFKEENTATQNEQCLRNFDLSEYRQVLSDIAVWIYQSVIRQMQEKVQQKAVAAILEHDAIPGLASSCKFGRGSSVSETPKEQPLDSLLQDLTSFHRILGLHGVDPELTVQVFKQLFYYICASSLNNLLLRKDLCHWSKGMQIRYNLSHVEQWARDQKLQDPQVIGMLAPIIQAAQLLQARKTDEDVTSVCEMCHNMTAHQIIKLLNLCTPTNDFEERVSMSFIRKIQQKLKEREDSQNQTLLMDTKFNFSVRFPFNPSNISLEDIDIPDSLHLPMLKKV